MSARDRHAGFAVLGLLADGERHSGQALAEALGVSRAAVWKQLQRLRALGVDVESRRGVGYRLRRPMELLDRSAILRALGGSARAVIERLELFTVVDSTSSYLFAGPRPAPGRLGVCLAEYQTGGRGRRGRSWRAPLGRGACLSVSWVFAAQPGALAALGLAAGLVARRVLRGATGLPIRIKWPNDLLVADRKVGGILVELAAESHGPCFVVLGIGVNVSATPALPREPGAWAGGATDLAAASGGVAPSRNTLCAALVDGFAELMSGYAATGFAPYQAEFADADYLYGRSIRVDGADGGAAGRAIGVGADGALLIEHAGGVTRIVSGDVSVRPEP